MLLLVVAIAICVAWFLAARGYWEDDAYIHLEFARSVAGGRGFSFNGHLVYGDTAPLWVWLLAGAHAVIPSWLAAGKALTAVAAVFGLSGCFFFGRAMVAGVVGRRQANLFAALLLLVIVTGPYFGYWAFSGMEALAAAGLVCFGALVVSGAGPISGAKAPFPADANVRAEARTYPEATTSTGAVYGVADAGDIARTYLGADISTISPWRFLAGAVIAGVAPLLRPEMGFLTVLLGLALLYAWLQMQQPLAARVYLLVAGLVLATEPGLVWAMYAVRTFGSVLPNTNAAKRAGPADSVVSRLLHVYAFGYPTIVLGVTVLALWGAFVAGRRLMWKGRTPPFRDKACERMGHPESRWLLLPLGGWLVLVWVAVTTIFYIANHTFVQTRYIFVAAPALLIVLFAIALRVSPMLFRAGLVVTLLYGMVVSVVSTRPLVRNKVEIDRRYAELATYVRGFPAGTKVAEYSIGEAAFLTERPLVDTGGITQPGVIPYLFPEDAVGLQAWVLRQGAQYEVAGQQPVAGATLLWSREVPMTGWYFNPRRYTAQESLRLWRLQ